VVVFDRIRENMTSRRRENLGVVINLSINEVLSRTIITGGTVVLHDFALAMLLGIFVSTYSSIFVASPFVFAWRKEIRRKAVKKEEAPDLSDLEQEREEKKAPGPEPKQKKRKKKERKEANERHETCI
jgi:hypothetical protein